MKPELIKQLSKDPLQQMIADLSVQDLYDNITGQTDFYKYTHPWQYNPKLEWMDMYCEARSGGMYPNISWVGLQMVIRENFMNVPKLRQLFMQRAWVKSAAGGFDYFDHETWDHISKLGYLPIEIWSLPEGLEVPEGTPLFKYRSTEPCFTKSQGLLEDTFMHVWAPTSMSSRTLSLKRSVHPYFEKSSCLEDMEYSVLDFSPRSVVNKYEAAAKGGAFLLHFKGSDNAIADQVMIMKHYYGKQRLKSVYATEHSTAMSFGLSDEGEKAYIMHQFNTAPLDAIVSFVTDTRDTKNFMEKIIGDSEVQAKMRERTGSNVARPDTGKSTDMLDLTFHYFDKYFGHHEKNEYKVLNNGCKTLIGNNVNEKTCPADYKYITDNGWAASNNVQAAGTGFFQWEMNRDTNRFAIKPNEGTIDGVLTPMAKFTSDAWKASKAGAFKVYRNDQGKIVTALASKMTRQEFDKLPDLFVRTWRNGQFEEEWTCDELDANIALTYNNF